MRLPIDMRALVLAAVAVTPLAAAWAFAEALFDALYYSDGFGKIVTDTASLALGWVIWTVGIVVMSTGGALFLQRKSDRLRPFAMVRSALVVVSLILFLESVNVGLTAVLVHMPNHDALIALTSQFIRVTSLLVAVAVASRLYLAWRRMPIDPNDGRRIIALSVIALSYAIASTMHWTIGFLTALWPNLPVPLSYFAISLLQRAVSEFIADVGGVFLFGYAALALLRRAHVELDLRWATVASVGALLAFGTTQGWIGALWAWWTAPDPNLVEINLVPLALALAIGALGGTFYVFVVDRETLRRALAGVPKSFAELRQWPYRVSDDE